MKTDALDKIYKNATDESSKWEAKADFRNENRNWLNKSAKIAIKILREIRLQKEKNGMSQKLLAEMLNVTPQYINKIVKGQENLSLETIAKLEKALGVSLVTILETRSDDDVNLSPIYFVDTSYQGYNYKEIIAINNMPMLNKVTISNSFNMAINNSTEIIYSGITEEMPLAA